MPDRCVVSLSREVVAWKKACRRGLPSYPLCTQQPTMSTESLFVYAGALAFEKAILGRTLVYGKRSHVWTSRWDVKVSGLAFWIRLRFLLSGAKVVFAAGELHLKAVIRAG